ncbi:hypothetical protein ILUMI_01946 [Ignelater luminosus]|uniref:Tc1-like transposase DDE domain-containing protein n=1 Tax=Ignelater luminosus TaxID=2038154 RepID=A0A8K0DHG8_IGNLU|nr:hypothetical protein ILUMI_01946 [Ignelater luminosus]
MKTGPLTTVYPANGCEWHRHGSSVISRGLRPVQPTSSEAAPSPSASAALTRTSCPALTIREPSSQTTMGGSLPATWSTNLTQPESQKDHHPADGKPATKHLRFRRVPPRRPRALRHQPRPGPATPPRAAWIHCFVTIPTAAKTNSAGEPGSSEDQLKYENFPGTLALPPDIRVRSPKSREINPLVEGRPSRVTSISGSWCPVRSCIAYGVNMSEYFLQRSDKGLETRRVGSVLSNNGSIHGGKELESIRAIGAKMLKFVLTEAFLLGRVSEFESMFIEVLQLKERKKQIIIPKVARKPPMRILRFLARLVRNSEKNITAIVSCQLLNIAGTVSWYGGYMAFQSVGRMNFTEYEVLLPSVRKIFSEDDPTDYYFQTDNAPCYTSMRSKQWFKNNKIPCLDWPPQSPDLSSIKHLWTVLKKNVHKHQCKSRVDLKQRIFEEWELIAALTC